MRIIRTLILLAGGIALGVALAPKLKPVADKFLSRFTKKAVEVEEAKTEQ